VRQDFNGTGKRRVAGDRQAVAVGREAVLEVKILPQPTARRNAGTNSVAFIQNGLEAAADRFGPGLPRSPDSIESCGALGSNLRTLGRAKRVSRKGIEIAQFMPLDIDAQRHPRRSDCCRDNPVAVRQRDRGGRHCAVRPQKRFAIWIGLNVPGIAAGGSRHHAAQHRAGGQRLIGLLGTATGGVGVIFRRRPMGDQLRGISSVQPGNAKCHATESSRAARCWR